MIPIDQNCYQWGDCPALHIRRAERKRCQQPPVTKCIERPLHGFSHADWETPRVAQIDRFLPAICPLHSLLIIATVTKAITKLQAASIPTIRFLINP